MKTSVLFFGVVLAACSGGAPILPIVDAGPGIPRPVVEGGYGFDAGLVLESSQTSGGGAQPVDNLSISVEEGCGGSLSDRSVSISLYSRDHSKIAAGAIPAERQSSGTASGNFFANVTYQDFGTPILLLSAKSGTVTMTTVDFDKLQNNAGSFEVMLDLPDGGSSRLAGSFDGRYLCR